MIAIVSSTVFPSQEPSHDGARTTLTPEVRLEQTRATVDSLIKRGIGTIIIADNSPGTWLQERAKILSPAKVIHFSQPPIKNKGIGELWLLLSSKQHLSDEPVMKISGRYFIGQDSDLALREGDDISAKVTGSGAGTELSTRCYLIRNGLIAARFWERTLDEMYSESSRIVGPRSLVRIVRNSWAPHSDGFRYADPNNISIEQASFRAISRLGLRLRRVGNLGIQGILGSWTNPLVSE